MNDEELWGAFGRGELSHSEWTHRAHVRVGYLHLERMSFEEALETLRAAITRLNAAHGVAETAQRGYNETITAAFLRIVDCMRRVYPDMADSEEFCDANPQIMNPRVLRLYYSPGRLWLPEAKGTFLEPDLATLPRPLD